MWLGLPDPCETRRRVEATDPVRSQLAGLLTTLHQHFEEATFQVAEVLLATADNIALREAIAPIVATTSPGQGCSMRRNVLPANRPPARRRHSIGSRIVTRRLRDLEDRTCLTNQTGTRTPGLPASGPG